MTNTPPATIHLGDCIEVMRALPENSMDAIVTDPPYGLGFMGKAWDELPPGEEWARECLRVLKPGGHLLAFGGSRTWHRLAVAVEDAGFEVRDSIAWLYGQGFSKGGLLGNRVGLAWCECTNGANAVPYNHADIADLPRVRDDIHPPTITRGEGGDASLLPTVQRGGQGSGVGEARTQGPGRMVTGERGGAARADVWRHEPGMEGRGVPRAGQGLSDGADAGPPEGAGEWLRGGTPARDGAHDWPARDAARGSASHQPRQGGQQAGELEAVPGSHVALDDGALRGRPECARCGGLNPAFRGFSTTLKPAFEPIVVARKPIVGTVAANVLAHGTGALNIDGCRVGLDGEKPPTGSGRSVQRTSMEGGAMRGVGAPIATSPAGRWPANVVLDESQAEALDEQSGYQRTGTTGPGAGGFRTEYVNGERKSGASFPQAALEQGGGASRFFYVAKAATRERPKVDGVAHPTVKPLALMRWLVRLVTPPGGTVLEPFAGSGTTVEACALEGFSCIAIEREPDYLPLIQARLARVEAAQPEPAGPSLFDMEETA